MATASERLEQQQDGLALQHASQEMKGDRELCMAAVAQDGQAIQYMNADMRCDLEIIRIATEQHLKEFPEDKGVKSELEKGVWKWIPEHMKSNAHVLKMVGIKGND